MLLDSTSTIVLVLKDFIWYMRSNFLSFVNNPSFAGPVSFLQGNGITTKSGNTDVTTDEFIKCDSKGKTTDGKSTDKEVFDEEGNLKQKISSVSENKDGKKIQTKTINEYEKGEFKKKIVEIDHDGELKFKETYNEKNEMSCREEFSHTKKDGKVFSVANQTYYENGKVISTGITTYENERYVNGKNYDTKGRLNYEINCSYGEKDGDMIRTQTEYKDERFLKKKEDEYVDKKLKITTTYREDDTKKSLQDHANKTIDYFDKAGNLIGKDLLNDDGTMKDSWMYKHDGRTKLTINSSTKLKELKEEMNSPERYSLFESMVNTGVYKISDDTKHKLRICGEQFQGIDKETKRLEEKYGVKINTSSSGPSGYACKLIHISSVQDRLQELDKEMKKYSPGFFKGRGLQISLFDELKNTERKGNLSCSAGVHSGKAIYLSHTEAFDHEMYHFLEYNHAGYHTNNPAWEELFKQVGGYKGNKGYVWYDSNGNKVNILTPGLDNSYAMCSTDEDQAVKAKRLFLSGEDGFLEGLQYLAEHRKVMEEQRKFLMKEYFIWSAHLQVPMDKRYFNDVRNGIDDWDKYWQMRLAEKNHKVQ